MWIAVGIIGGAVVGAGAAIYSANQQGDAIESAAEAQITAQQQAQQQAMEASERASAMMAAATTEAARIQAAAAKHAADQQYAAATEALAVHTAEWKKMQQNMGPYLEAGGKGLNQLSYGLGLPGYSGTGEAGYLQKAFDEKDFAANFTKSPGYEFRLSEGVKALDRSASASGNLLSGQQLKGVTRYGQDFASNEYQNAYNRSYSNYIQNQDTQFNHLAYLTNMGQNTAVQQGQAGANYASNYGETLLGATTAANAYNLNAANSQANLLTQNAQYSGNAGMNAAALQGQYGTNIASIKGNAALQQASINASMYQGIGNSLSNALGQYYMYKGYGGGGSGGGGYTPYYNTNITPAPYQTAYGSYSLSP